MSQPSIILLVPYFGKWPLWFDYFLLSCRFNSSIQWLFYTDCPVPKSAPSNVSFKEISFTAYKKKVSNTLGIDFNPDNPYKLCDLKPALGFVHDSDIANYDFWGFSDIDLVYGDLRQYYTAERLSKYDLYSTHNRRVSGHFCLMRNTKKMREAFKLIKNWRELLADNTHHAIDDRFHCGRDQNIALFLQNLAPIGHIFAIRIAFDADMFGDPLMDRLDIQPLVIYQRAIMLDYGSNKAAIFLREKFSCVIAHFSEPLNNDAFAVQLA